MDKKISTGQTKPVDIFNTHCLHLDQSLLDRNGITPLVEDIIIQIKGPVIGIIVIRFRAAYRS